MLHDIKPFKIRQITRFDIYCDAHPYRATMLFEILGFEIKKNI